MELQNQVLRNLVRRYLLAMPGGTTARLLTRMMSLPITERRAVNRILYDMERNGTAVRDTSCPPVWRPVCATTQPAAAESPTPDAPSITIFVDLDQKAGSWHQLVQLQTDNIYLCGVCSAAYTGPGSEIMAAAGSASAPGASATEPTEKCRVVRCPQGPRSVADMVLIFNVVRLLQTTAGMYIIIHSSDRIFEAALSAMELEFPAWAGRVQICNTLQDVRECVE